MKPLSMIWRIDARPPSEISVLNVIEAVEGPIALNFCQSDPPKCDEVMCPLRPVWTELQEIIATRLADVTLQVLIDNCPTE